MTQSNYPQLSVVIAAYNAEDTLDAQLKALQRQDVPFEWEVLVCDNGSSDATVDVVRRWLSDLPNLRLIDASRQRGPGAARNEGARAARAPWLAFCDADDVVDEGWVREMHAAMGAHRLVTGLSRRPELNSPPDSPRYFSWSVYHVPFFPYLGGAGAGNLAIHKSVFDEVGGFDESLRTGEDLDLCWRVQLVGNDLTVREGARVTVRNREGLGASFRQAFAYGVGDKRLQHKYALVADAYRRLAEPVEHDVSTPPEEPVTAEPAPRRSLRTIARKVIRLRRPSDLTDVTHRTATALGFRYGAINRADPQVRPPEHLPPASIG